MNPIVKGKVKNGKFKPDSPTIFAASFKMFEGQEVEVIVRKPKTIRSNYQNKYMWGVVYKMIADFTGDDSDSVHDNLRQLFLWEPSATFGRKMKSTTKCSTVELEEYLEQVRRWALQILELNIPLPNEVDFE